MKIAIDGMGGDNAPKAIVEGALMAIKEYDIDIVITGDSNLINAEIEKNGYSGDRIEVVHTTEVIKNEEKPVNAIRTKKDSSLVVAMNLVKEKKADAVISAGSTGAILSGGVFILRRIKGISRPCICTEIPTMKGSSVLLADSGANSDCQLQHIKDFAVMSDIYSKRVLGKESPRVALANIGVEEGKGNEFTKQAFDELKKIDGINFIGNMETRDILEDVCDVVVCDGFTGNMILKTIEGSVLSLFGKLKEILMKSTKSKIGAALIKDELRSLKDILDYSNYGGAPFIGVDGCVIKAHGSSNSTAIKNAIKQSIRFTEGDVLEEIKKYASRV